MFANQMLAIKNWQQLLALESESGSGELDRQCFFIHYFEKAGAKLFVNANSGSYDSICQFCVS